MIEKLMSSFRQIIKEADFPKGDGPADAHRSLPGDSFQDFFLGFRPGGKIERLHAVFLQIG
jgi:hypothetical protein